MSRKTRTRAVQPVARPTPPVPAAAPTAESPTKQIGCLAVLARLYWLGAGNLVLLGAAVAAARAEALVSAGAVALWAAAASLVAVRFFDVTRLGGHTSDGEPATLAHWRRYAISVVVATAALWAVGRVLHDSLL